MLALHLLGRFEVDAGPAGPAHELIARPKAAAVLAYLACARRKGHVRRATLLPLFWPEADEAAARHTLSQTLYRVRQVLGPVILTRGEEELLLDPEKVTIDVERFDDALAAGRPDEALRLYVGDLMPGLAVPLASGFEDWLERERQRLRLLAADAATAVAMAAIARGEAGEGERTALRALQLDPAREDATRDAVVALLHAGDRARAARLYLALRDHLAHELEVSPAPATLALEASVLEPRVLPARVPPPRDPPPRLLPPRLLPPRLLPPRLLPPRLPSPRLPSPRSRPGTVEASPSVPLADPPRPAPGVRRAVAATLVAAVTIGVAYVAVEALMGGNEENASLAVPVVAIAPFALDSSDVGFEYLADGLHGAVVGELTLAAAVRVLDGEGTDGAAMVEGRVSRLRDTVRAHIEIRHGAPGSRRWSGDFERPAADVLLLQRDLARTLVQQLGLRLTARGRARFSSSPVVQAAAYDAWLRGKALQRHRRRDDLLACSAEAARALALAPDFAEAHLLRAECENVRTFVDRVEPAVSFGNAIASAERAIAVDPGLAGAHAALAYAVAHHRWDWPAAERSFERALALQPEQASTHGDLAWMLAWIGRTDEARRHAREAVRLAPADPHTLLRAGMIEHLDRRHGAALEWAQRALSLDSTFMFSWDRIHFANTGLGHLGDAVHAAERASALGGPGDLRRRGFLANAYARAGRVAEARRILADLDALDGAGYVPPVALAAARIGLGELDAAFLALERSVEERDGDVVLLATFPMWDPLRADPRFIALLQRVGFPQVRRRRGAAD